VEPYPCLKCGEKVRITRGSLKGIEGVLVRKKNLYRIVLCMELLQQCSGDRCQRCRACESVEFYSRNPESNNRIAGLRELVALFSCTGIRHLPIVRVPSSTTHTLS
jgi:hypothetical protein